MEKRYDEQSKIVLQLQQEHAELIGMIKNSGKFKTTEAANERMVLEELTDERIKLLTEFTKVVPSDSERVEQISHSVVLTKSGIIDTLYSPNNCFKIRAFGEIYLNSSGLEIDYRIRYATSGINILRSKQVDLIPITAKVFGPIKHDCTNLICVKSVSPCNVELNEEEKATLKNMFCFESVFMAIQSELVKRNLISSGKGDAQRLEEFIEKKYSGNGFFAQRDVKTLRLDNARVEARYFEHEWTSIGPIAVCRPGISRQ